MQKNKCTEKYYFVTKTHCEQLNEFPHWPFPFSKDE